jgi:FKBP-type peptidyl-prolyl cis-trans isomerase
LYEIDELMHKVKLNEKAVIKYLTERLIGDRRTSQAARKKETAMLNQRIRKLETAISRLYEERYIEQIPEDAFLTQIQTNETERLQAEERLTELETTEQEAENKMGDIQNWIRLIKENATVTELNRDLLLALVDKIEIGEGRTVNGVRERDVVIHYKFIGTVTDSGRVNQHD